MGLVLEVKLICQHDVYGIEIQIPSTSGDKTNVWMVISRSRNRSVGELLYGESENLPAEVLQESVQEQEKEHSQGDRPMNTVADTAGKPKSGNLSVNRYKMRFRENERQMEQFIGKSDVQSSSTDSKKEEAVSLTEIGSTSSTQEATNQDYSIVTIIATDCCTFEPLKDTQGEK